ncbi:MAG: protein-L-isoaspartate O-methyltransferase [Sulfurospirillaceae bacterium]|nr:protein-L-isoaspartate O-methyltransferase [Sulfurospirillaceae bacterium]
MSTNKELIFNMVQSGVLKSGKIIKAFENIDRKYFVPEYFSTEIYGDYPLPIGKDQTISQPSTVAFMLELLDAKEGNKVLDIGSGSGWTTALLSEIVGKDGEVTGVERVEKLVEVGQKNLAFFDFKNTKIELATELLGKPKKKFDRILVSASAPQIPVELFEQLNAGGVLVVPVKNSIFRFKKMPDLSIQKSEYIGFRFVPLIY